MNSGMSLENHRLVRSAFSRPPVFGDTEQIKAMHLTAPAPLEEGKEKRFKVMVSISGDFTEYVDANSMDEAIEEVKDNMDSIPDGCECDITAVEVHL